MNAVTAIAFAALVSLAGCASTPEATSEPEAPGEGGIVLRAGDRAVIHPDGTADIDRDQATTARMVIAPSDPAAHAKLDAYRAAEEQATRQALISEIRMKRIQWLKLAESQPFLQWLCALPPGTNQTNAEFFAAAGKYGFVPKRDPASDAHAADRGYAILDCSTLTSSEAAE